MVFCCFSSEPPEKSSWKEGSAKAKWDNRLIGMAGNPNQFDTNLMDAPCKAPLPCCCTFLLTPCCGIPTCYWRKKALEQYGNGMEDYMCTQGMEYDCCCFKPGRMGDKGNVVCLLLEGCCCSVRGMSYTRLYIMDNQNIRPDPVDYQIIAFSNCMQILACICHIASCIVPALDNLADLISCIADMITLTVTGCMGAQISLQIENDQKNVGQVQVAVPVPTTEGGAPAVSAKMER
mmetsp:Transcript_16292/g.37967  ORF Transcript_16292/g.37967 Transcript_16292/m.37967 type:complete len:234 (+) Transcript_16292:108-809(+)|eukprot:CAMPEP_0182558916 /NCGR_PEP_ID=MMETSP1324-20130603/2231_1 /TAXON_ID=236786 /ORGANISM="Florenciella sp., Strain RCC1587" /LENGTH=233 /DNA_ID=CAMNT_0024771121 /DNA_START=89 /DNA_END=790 /DNA_ORIENTATION=-